MRDVTLVEVTDDSADGAFVVERIQRFINDTLDRLGITLIPTDQRESTLRDAATYPSQAGYFPQDAIVYVHGNMALKYRNVGRLAALLAARPDLSGIVTVDEIAQCPDFWKPADYDLALQCAGLDASRQLSVVHAYSLLTLFAEQGPAVSAYLTQWATLHPEGGA
ncbi:hypothetical protein COY28_07125 [Candidatus Woesearchaeota archaeon CG_4_10_14_0_2_um_filter_57_5]|nr:MAG: hypothetical protein COY28_07125 [Candidatus Woesearchaeota archaeon CG_4_10_14_0_2_um_filter_57_5]